MKDESDKVSRGTPLRAGEIEAMAEFHKAARDTANELRLCAEPGCNRWSLEEYCILHR